MFIINNGHLRFVLDNYEHQNLPALVPLHDILNHLSPAQNKCSPALKKEHKYPLNTQLLYDTKIHGDPNVEDYRIGNEEK